MANTIPSGQLIKLLHDRLEKQANNTLRGKELTLMQISALMELQKAEQKQRSMKELERKFCVAQSTVAGIISRLEQKGFVVAFGDASDKRIKVVHITPAGETCCRIHGRSGTNAAAWVFRGRESLIQSAFGKGRRKYEVNTRQARRVSLRT